MVAGVGVGLQVSDHDTDGAGNRDQGVEFAAVFGDAAMIQPDLGDDQLRGALADESDSIEPLDGGQPRALVDGVDTDVEAGQAAVATLKALRRPQGDVDLTPTWFPRLANRLCPNSAGVLPLRSRCSEADGRPRRLM
ncbi:hypothetical protein BB737_02800 [Mycobacterium avium subsp. hominissuis]|uniref:Uncharacterized protein n=1 Tax=Mycobacterium avium subsp. hominissuis TaxID=439334 RepID=A0A2A3L943_MYCAV|nr:hypothetical protein [Mycobacterium avium]PBJ35062.1 hypothetical protein XV03_11160 [Mycobacterium avium subsp. hominissuis]PBJ43716.1 hypothetical protein BI294_01345 [Mycobacterium avium subsp. hominissuis]PBJ67307.1 hypothetical protein BB737_02800 [Mycobacterium avium subsp. hominissuis]QXD08159.1 hypothetical protein BB735_011805 [Mycobacterium avium subsp. hominissuis]